MVTKGSFRSLMINRAVKACFKFFLATNIGGLSRKAIESYPVLISVPNTGDFFL